MGRAAVSSQVQMQTKSGMRHSARLSLSQMGFRSIFEIEDNDDTDTNVGGSNNSTMLQQIMNSGSSAADVVEHNENITESQVYTAAESSEQISLNLPTPPSEGRGPIS